MPEVHKIYGCRIKERMHRNATEKLLWIGESWKITKNCYDSNKDGKEEMDYSSPKLSIAVCRKFWFLACATRNKAEREKDLWMVQSGLLGALTRRKTNTSVGHRSDVKDMV